MVRMPVRQAHQLNRDTYWVEDVDWGTLVWLVMVTWMRAS